MRREREKKRNKKEILPEVDKEERIPLISGSYGLCDVFS